MRLRSLECRDEQSDSARADFPCGVAINPHQELLPVAAFRPVTGHVVPYAAEPINDDALLLFRPQDSRVF